jgi:hypothetical protein
MDDEDFYYIPCIIKVWSTNTLKALGRAELLCELLQEDIIEYDADARIEISQDEKVI